MSEYPHKAENRQREPAPDYRALLSTLRELITKFLTGHHGLLIAPFMHFARKVFKDLKHTIRENMAAAREIFRRRPSNQCHPYPELHKPVPAVIPHHPFPAAFLMVGAQTTVPADGRTSLASTVDPYRPELDG